MSIQVVNLIVAIALGLLSFCTAGVSCVSAIVLIQYRQKTVENKNEEIRSDLKAAVSELHAVSTLVQTMMREQAVINRTMEMALQALITKVDRHERDVAKLMAKAEADEGNSDQG